MKKAFTMIELVFVIVVLGILATIALPRFNATRDDAIITKAKTIVANVRSALSSEVQRRALSGDYTAVANLGGETNAYDKEIFNYFDGDENKSRVLEYPIRSCKNAGATGCWMRTGNNTYQFKMPPAIGGTVDFKVDKNRFECTSDWDHCKYLER